jgi:hypothetical protein
VLESIATTLVPDDTNRAFDVFRRDRLTGTTVRVSVAGGVTLCDRFKPATAFPPGAASWLWPSFSDNGRYVAVVTSPGAGTLVIAPNPL